jgi:hypothetical protein
MWDSIDAGTIVVGVLVLSVVLFVLAWIVMAWRHPEYLSLDATLSDSLKNSTANRCDLR